MDWVDKHIEIAPPKRPKKLTGTRFATILGLNPWSTPFEIWCAVTRTYEKPFEDTIYTAAGKVIEPKQAEYMKLCYGMYNLKTPTDLFGENYFNKTYGDFFHENPVLGGMWDYLLVDEDGKPETVLEMKTTKRSEDWKNGVPEYYALQASLYAYLLGIDNVIMVASFLSADDYDHPETFLPKASNTMTVEFKVSERYPDFQNKVDTALEWWSRYVEGGISPDYDEKRDKEILDALRKNTLSPDTDIMELVKEAEALKAKVDEEAVKMSAAEKRLKEISEIIKQYAKNQFRDGDKKVEVKGSVYTWTLAKSETTTIDKDALARDGILDKYQIKSESYRLTVK